MGRVFLEAEPYLDQLKVGHWVEIGCGRAGDDGSTRQLAEWAQQYSPTGRLTTVDVDPVNCDFVRALNLDNIEIINSTGEEYLDLDNFDWDWHPDKTEDFVLDQQQRYATLGMPEMNNVNSQCAHLRQAELAIRSLAPISLVVCDDTWYNKWWGHYSGKSGAVVPFLLNHGFEVIYTEEQPVYGTILGRRLKRLN